MLSAYSCGWWRDVWSARGAAIFTMLLCLALLMPTVGVAQEQKGEKVSEALPSAAEIAKLPKDGGKEFNRLIFEKSPYLLQHARNPVDWYPWGKEAFARAKKENKPIFLSVGYSTCHWCHVMEHESFEHKDVAKIMNAYFVCIKVDREERPDIDEIYMSATQAFFQLTRQNRSGGWPNSVWLDAEARPWYAGTYFPREMFKKVLEHTHSLWQKEREAVNRNAEILARHLQQNAKPQASAKQVEISAKMITAAVANLQSAFDAKDGGFGNAPKFPPHQSLALLLLYYEKTQDKAALTMITKTLDAMAHGGIRDQIGGGFHRYSTDRKWFLPHFEKMLYDNAQLAKVYVQAYRLTKKDLYREVAVETFDWVLRAMTDPAGGFYSALDADSDGEEGKFYLWKPSEIKSILGEREGGLFCQAYNITDAGNYYEEASRTRPGTSIVWGPEGLEKIAAAAKLDVATLRKQFARNRVTLRKVRAKRVWPHLDDKVLTSWNGLMIGALATGGKYLGEPRYTQAAIRAANFILTKMRRDGRLLRTYRDGSAKLTAYLDDYSFLADGLLDLYETTGDARWLREAKKLLVTLELFYRDAKGGGFFFTAQDHEALLLRSKDCFDKAIPSGNGIAAKVLARLATITGDADYAKQAREVIAPFQEYIWRAPRATMSLLQACEYLLTAKSNPATTALGTFISNRKFGSEKPNTSRHQKKPVTAELFFAHTQLTPGGSTPFAVRLIIEKGYHVNAHKTSSEFIIPTTLTLKNGAGCEVSQISYPAAEKYLIEETKETLAVYTGTTFFRGTLTVPQNLAPGQRTITFTMSTQACSDQSCLPTDTFTLSLPLNIVKGVKLGAVQHPEIFAPAPDSEKAEK